MHGHRTCVILGAGASFDYEEGLDRVPLQRSFFHYIRYHCITPPVRGAIEVATSQNFNDFAIRFLGGTSANPWREISNDEEGPNNDLGLEAAYRRVLDADISDDDKKLIVASLNTILCATIASIVIERSNPERICRFHRRLAQLLEPGDVVISFNYDCLVDDAMLYGCPHWFPRTGYGVPIEAIHGVLPGAKAQLAPSDVLLLHPHGSILFRTDWRDVEGQGNMPALLLLGLNVGLQMLSTPMTLLKRSADGKYDVLPGITIPDPVSWTRQPPSGSQSRAQSASAHDQPTEIMLEPLIVYPTPTKERVYLHDVSAAARRALGRTEVFLIYFVGYSLPVGDRRVPDMFPVDALCQGRTVVVNAAGNESWLRQNYARAFPGLSLEFRQELFWEWVMAL